MNSINVKITTNKYNNWNILINKQIYGMIVKINNIYDLLLSYQKIIIDRQFNEFDECCDFIRNL